MMVERFICPACRSAVSPRDPHCPICGVRFEALEECPRNREDKIVIRVGMSDNFDDAYIARVQNVGDFEGPHDVVFTDDHDKGTDMFGDPRNAAIIRLLYFVADQLGYIYDDHDKENLRIHFQKMSEIEDDEDDEDDEDY